ncbi:MAG: hypothetical protein JWM95_814 [Gemmatimonadetes bacterium]|nr:hypothetical protein [Gemmatimonadota bacterium]
MQTTHASAAHPALHSDIPLQRLTTPANRPLARRIAWHAVLLGVSADVLLKGGPHGAAFPIWIGLAALSLIAMIWRADRVVSRETGWWLATAVLFACVLAWRDAEMLALVDVLATLGALAMAAIAISSARSALFATRLRDTVWAAASLLRSIIAGWLPFTEPGLIASGPYGRIAHRVGPIARAAIIGSIVLFVFGSLLRSADPIFASIFALPELDASAIVAHVLVTTFFSWLVSGWARGALLVNVGARRPPDVFPLSLSALDVSTALGILNVLFGAFVVTQLGWFFGGETFLHARTGLTASAYARQGFFEML